MVGNMGSVIDHFIFENLSKKTINMRQIKMKIADTLNYFMNLVTESNSILNIHDGLMLRIKMKSLLGILEFAYVNSNIILFQLKQKNEFYYGGITDKVENAEKLSIDNKNIFDNASAYFLNYENKLIKDIMINEEAEYRRGSVYGKISLEFILINNDIVYIENKHKLSVTKRWFNNFNQITEIRKMKLENHISWDEMKSRINKILRVK